MTIPQFLQQIHVTVALGVMAERRSLRAQVVDGSAPHERS
jgi:hypothetical protein